MAVTLNLRIQLLFSARRAGFALLEHNVGKNDLTLVAVGAVFHVSLRGTIGELVPLISN